MARVPTHAWSAQAVGITVNGLANMRCSDTAGFQVLKQAALGLVVTDLDPPALAAIVNAFARPNVLDNMETAPLFHHLASAACSLPAEAFNPQAVALTARAFAKPGVAQSLGARSQMVVETMSKMAHTFDATHWSPQGVAMLMLRWPLPLCRCSEC